MKLSLSSRLSASIPATASNPKGLPSTLVNLSTSRGGMTFVSHGFHVFGGVHVRGSPVSPQFHFGDPPSLERGFENWESKDFMIPEAFSTQACISRSDFSSASMESHFQSLVTIHWNSGEVVTAWKKASNPVSFWDVDIWEKLGDFISEETDQEILLSLVFREDFLDIGSGDHESISLEEYMRIGKSVYVVYSLTETSLTLFKNWCDIAHLQKSEPETMPSRIDERYIFARLEARRHLELSILDTRESREFDKTR